MYIIPLGLFMINLGIALMYLGIKEEINKKFELRPGMSVITAPNTILEGKDLAFARLNNFKLNETEEVPEILILIKSSLK